MATRLPSGKWRAQVLIGTDINGTRRYRSFIGDSEDEADFLALQYKVQGKKTAKGDISLSKAIDKYIEDASRHSSPTTIEGYKKIKRCYCEALLPYKIHQITRDLLQLHADNLHARGLSPKTVKEAVYFIKTVLKTNGFRLDEIKLPRKKTPEYNTPSPTQMQEIILSVKDTDLELPVLLASWLTLTRSECAGLKWSDIRDGVLYVKRSMVYAEGQMHLKDTKTETRERALLIPDYLQKLLDAQKEKATGDFVVEMTPDKISDRFRSHMLKHKELHYCSFHELRHFAASLALILNIPDKYMQKRGGWSTSKVMRASYQQTFSEYEKAVAAQIDNYFTEHLL